ncbi:MAG TPA: metallophosphoesterase [Polyangiaceae bacterium]|nr:metallophosphoesterase [Polyangiaceae bacterium]
MSWLVVGSCLAWALVVMLALGLRSRAYAIFRGIQLGLHTLIALAIAPTTPPLLVLFIYLHASVYLHSLSLVRPRLRPLWYRALISLPSAFFGAGTLLALPWALAAALGWHLPAVWLPYAAALLGLVQSLTVREEQVDVVVADGSVPGLRRHVTGAERVERPLRIVQITDPHLGPFMSVGRLRSIVESAVRRDPDLVLLTGDFLTMESQSDPALLATALEPLLAIRGRAFACFGNHDHEAPATVRHALTHAGVQLLMDESAIVHTGAGPVHIIGADFVFRGREAHLARLCADHPRVPGTLRLLLLHDPSAFRHLPEGEADLVLSGHTHGGQVGLVSLGLPWTMMRLFVKAPDHGLWARGTDRLYVHRGTGHYGFPLRIGVPAENSLLQVHAPGLEASLGPS